LLRPRTISKNVEPTISQPANPDSEHDDNDSISKQQQNGTSTTNAIVVETKSQSPTIENQNVSNNLQKHFFFIYRFFSLSL
jgi:hypothetical protein